MMEQIVDLSGEEGGHAAMADDGTVLRFDSILRYQLLESALGEFRFGLKRPLEHVTGLFTCLLRNEIANFRAAGDEASTRTGEEKGSYALIRRERRELNRRIEAFARQKIGERYGVRFNAVDLTDVLPPDELANALNAVLQSRVEAEGMYARAEADCGQRVLAAHRGVAIAKARAAATETEILTLAGVLEDLDRDGTLDLYVTRRRAEVTSESRAVFLKGEP
jgi:regulator of protease activity HflC (stomatin/prohibitin superfamily)